MNQYLSIGIILGFISSVIIGTLSHELGHFIPAKIFGYETTFHYASVESTIGPTKTRLSEIYEVNEEAIISEEAYPEEDERNKLLKTYKVEQTMITLGGPFQTMLFGTIGFLVLIYRRRKKTSVNFILTDWILVFLALFWSREPFNLLTALMQYIILGSNTFHGDEFRLADIWRFPHWSISILFGIIGAVLCLSVIFRMIPKEHRLRFIISGLIGCSTGVFLWFMLLGPILL